MSMGVATIARGRDLYLGHAPPPPDALPPPPAALVWLGRAFALPRLTVRVRTVPAFRRWLAWSRPGDRAVYYEGDEPLAGGRLPDALLGPLADEALRQSTARDMPMRSACGHIRGRLNGQGRVRLHTERLPWGQGCRCVAVRI